MFLSSLLAASNLVLVPPQMTPSAPRVSNSSTMVPQAPQTVPMEYKSAPRFLKSFKLQPNWHPDRQRPVFHGPVAGVLLACGRSFSRSRSTSRTLLLFSRSFSTSFSPLEVLLEVLSAFSNSSRSPFRLLEVLLIAFFAFFKFLSRSFRKSFLSFRGPSLILLAFLRSFSRFYAPSVSPSRGPSRHHLVLYPCGAVSRCRASLVTQRFFSEIRPAPELHPHRNRSVQSLVRYVTSWSTYQSLGEQEFALNLLNATV